ncbi:helix-turn-helix domain-containing protein (plasmid) [Burkholderia vietnamiensis]|uniref:Putative transcriptional regulator, XRE family n=1 Tax=Burkholderia vietnamiensis (strain G4 / LMG 22486) TaxID=269482 RepID=A4JWD0_BURVG|nr:putative transcriptional regulator, XRE family [Burkholderia vietnamiensis G4]MCB4349758.1 helix-turn-helix domain-containing protein [Burkholderia vietnamiensis]
MHTSKTISALRTKAKLTQKQIASALGCSQPHVHYLEHGDVKKPRTSAAMVDGLKALCAKHGVPVVQ